MLAARPVSASAFSSTSSVRSLLPSSTNTNSLSPWPRELAASCSTVPTIRDSSWYIGTTIDQRGMSETVIQNNG